MILSYFLAFFNKFQFHESQNPVTKFECVSVAPWDEKKLQLLGLD